MNITVMDKLLSANDAWAAQIRDFLQKRDVCLINLIGSPGSGKTSLLEHTIPAFHSRYPLAVIEGDIATSRDAQRIQRRGVQAYQINTGTACHLDAHLVYAALQQLCGTESPRLIFVENIGNLVCPAEFDIGEAAKIAVLSVTEGDDKIEKYPLLFTTARAVVITKIDLLPHTNFDLTAAEQSLKALNPTAPFITVDSLSGTNIAAWYAFLEQVMISPKVAG